VLKFPAWLAVAALACLVLVPVPGIPFLWVHRLFGDVLENSAHPVIFALLAWFAYRATGRPVLVFLLAAVLGGGTEILQHFIGRDASWFDFGNDLLGAGFSLSLAQWWTRRWRLAWLGLGGLCALLAALPMGVTLVAYASQAERFPLLWDQDSVLDRLFASETGPPYPGFSLDEPIHDWRGFRALQVDLVSGADESLDVAMRVHDGHHNQEYSDRYNETFRLKPRSWQRIEVPLRRIELAPRGRKMDLSAVRAVMLFRQSDDPARSFQVQAVRLVR
jgi:hypothetical protein